jgi:hypothetical protein
VSVAELSPIEFSSTIEKVSRLCKIPFRHVTTEKYTMLTTLRLLRFRIRATSWVQKESKILSEMQEFGSTEVQILENRVFLFWKSSEKTEPIIFHATFLLSSNKLRRIRTILVERARDVFKKRRTSSPEYNFG